MHRNVDDYNKNIFPVKFFQKWLVMTDKGENMEYLLAQDKLHNFNLFKFK